MGRQISKQNLWRSVLGGIKDAQRAHASMSNRRFGQEPEYWVTSMVARRLAKNAPGCGVELEATVREVLEAAGAKKQGRPSAALRIGGRFDIVLWWKSKKSPRALIEMKHPVRKGDIGKVTTDVHRILEALRRGTETRLLDWGCVAFYCTSSPRASSKGKGKALAEIRDTLKALKKSVRALDRIKGYAVRLREGTKRPVKDEDAAGHDTRYGKACCVTVRRLNVTLES